MILDYNCSFWNKNDTVGNGFNALHLDSPQLDSLNFKLVNWTGFFSVLLFWIDEFLLGKIIDKKKEKTLKGGETHYLVESVKRLCFLNWIL